MPPNPPSNGEPRAWWPDTIMLVVFRLYSIFAVAVSAGLLLLSMLQFWYAFQIGLIDLKHPLITPITYATNAWALAGTPKTEPPVITNGNVVPPGSGTEKLPSETEETDLSKRKECAKQSLVFAIHGLEFVILAPICFVIARSLLIYIALKFAFARGSHEMLASQTELQEAGASLIAAKALIVGLLSGLVGVDIVSRILESKQAVDPSLWIMLAALAVLGGYYIALEWLAGVREKQLGSNSLIKSASEAEVRKVLGPEKPAVPPAGS